MKSSTMPTLKHAVLAILFLGLLALVLAVSSPGASDVMAQSPQRTSVTSSPEQQGWYMAGANPQRTSWVAHTNENPTEIRGWLNPVWYRPVEPYISQKTQLVISNDIIYTSTSKGLYAFHTGDNPTYPNAGDIAWVYPTEMPLGHSPTIHKGIAYVGGLDHKIHAIDAFTGQGLWTFVANKGFQTNPLVIDSSIDPIHFSPGEGKLYAGNRDGQLYAIYTEGAAAGKLAWSFQTDGPVLFSAAYKDNVVYFASNDMRAYALDAETGSILWKSDKLPGTGFHSWWPVVYSDQESGTDYVILPGGSPYRVITDPWPSSQDDLLPGNPDAHLHTLDLSDLYYDIPYKDYVGVRRADGTMDASRILDYYEEPTQQEQLNDSAGVYRHEHKPWRRTFILLGANNGKEYTYDPDNDGLPNYAPITWFGTKGAGNRQPAMIGPDYVTGTGNMIYQPMHYESGPYIPGGNIVGWKPGMTSFDTPMYRNEFIRNSVDEPMGYSGAGNLIYWSRNADRMLATVDPVSGEQWIHYGYSLNEKIPGYSVMFDASIVNDSRHVEGIYNGIGNGVNGLYGHHLDQNPPIPYKGKLYQHRSNAIVVFGDVPENTSRALPTAQIVPDALAFNSTITVPELRDTLQDEIQKILDAGHLKPGFLSHGLANLVGRKNSFLIDYWHYPSETLYVLSLAYPHLEIDQQAQVRNYMENEYENFPPYRYDHIGFLDGEPRQAFDFAPETQLGIQNYPKKLTYNTYYAGAIYPPQMFYHLWKYAEIMEPHNPGMASAIFGENKHRLDSAIPNDSYLDGLTTDEYLVQNPSALNALISGLHGYLQLKQLAGNTDADPLDVQQELDRLLALRVSTFSKDHPYEGLDYKRVFSISRNFQYLTPELADHLNKNIPNQIQEAVDEYQYVAPTWFISRDVEGFREFMINPLHNYFSLFQVKALILNEPYEELIKYLDVPAFERGDLFYIQNLVSAIEAAETTTPTPTQEIALSPGWNIISSYIDPLDPALETLLSEIAGDMVLIKNGGGEVYWPAASVNNIGDWDVRDGYKIYMNKAATLSLAGPVVDPSVTPLDLPAGWSTVAYLSGVPLAIDHALASIGGQLYMVKNGAGQVYWPLMNVNEIGQMQPGEGYQFYMETPGTLTYPES